VNHEKLRYHNTTAHSSLYSNVHDTYVALAVAVTKPQDF
jgi:hypothetical protein